jgi:tetratricopeptide (TPR) repeat protein
VRYFESQYGFGKYLFNENDFTRSIIELKKASYLNDFVSFKKADSINYMVGIAYSKINDYTQSNNYLARIPQNDSILFSKAAILTGKNLILSNNYDSAILYCKSVLDSKLLKTNPEKLTFMLASGYLLLNIAESAKKELTKANLTDSKLFSYSAELENFKPKNFFIAGVIVCNYSRRWQSLHK